MAFAETLNRLAPEVAADLAERLGPFLDLVTQRSNPVQLSDDVIDLIGHTSPDLAESLDSLYGQWKSLHGDTPHPAKVTILPDGTAIVDLPEVFITGFSADVNNVILAWVRRWNFGEDLSSWVAREASTTLSIWTEQTLNGDGPDGQLRMGLYVAFEDYGLQSVEEARRLINSANHDRSITLPGQEWNIRLESKADAYSRIMATLGQAVKENLERIEAEAKSRGDRPVPIKPAAVDHLKWLIRYHVKGEGYAAIAREVGRSRQAVMFAVREAANLIDLPLREPDRRGRPRKQTMPRIVKVHRRCPELDN
jgi:hypothetical protein